MFEYMSSLENKYCFRLYLNTRNKVCNFLKEINIDVIEVCRFLFFI